MFLNKLTVPVFRVVKRGKGYGVQVRWPYEGPWTNHQLFPRWVWHGPFGCKSWVYERKQDAETFAKVCMDGVSAMPPT